MGKIMIRNLNLTSIFLTIVGLILIGYGGWSIYRFRDFMWGAGLVTLGVGTTLFGYTGGFSDYSPKGQLFLKFGIAALVLGVLICGFVMAKQNGFI